MSNSPTTATSQESGTKEKTARKDDWAVDETDEDKEVNDGYNLKVPSFIRLFVIRRIIGNYINNTAKDDPKKIINVLINAFDDNIEIKRIANEILLKLICELVFFNT